MEPMHLYMAVVGCTPPGRFTEQHDVFFGISTSMKALVPELIQFWPEAKGKLHVDAWRKVTAVNGHSVAVVPVQGITETNVAATNKLFFLNLGGYKPGEFEEYHYKMLVAAPDTGKAIASARDTAFYRHCGFYGAESHVDDKYGIDVDDLHEVRDILDPWYKHQYTLFISDDREEGLPEDELHIGYFRLDKL